MAVLRNIVIVALIASLTDANLLRTKKTAPHPKTPYGGPIEPPTEKENPDTGGFDTQEGACATCRFLKTQTCNLYCGCTCVVANKTKVGKIEYHWDCDLDASSGYDLCFTDTSDKMIPAAQDKFGLQPDENTYECDDCCKETRNNADCR
eukprot:TRINITY_DN82_c1_g2_i3.p2 TRINITY_DN82_c1_g2~~TRINITY_DN82_c1_g2_i3.p2  ORF type:complete len:149 (+),score=32.61 TRINITY_DN82_c1_g2_i3:193-639(+)